MIYYGLRFYLLVSFVGLFGCSQDNLNFSVTTHPKLDKIKLSDLPGWNKDSVKEALVPLKRSCAKILRRNPNRHIGQSGFSGKVADWLTACKTLPPKGAGEETMRRYLGEQFYVYRVIGPKANAGLITGYFEPILKGSLTKTRKYSTAIYGVPNNLVLVNLGNWRKSLTGERVAGRVVGGTLKPYFSRQDIRKGALETIAKPILWMESDIDAFFLHIQGSGQFALDDGTIQRVGYAGHNGHNYFAIGKHLIELGAIKKNNISLQSIKKWLLTNNEKRNEIMDLNPSYIFFQKINGPGPIGAQGVALTAGRSLAVDRKFFPLGMPIWLNSEYLDENKRLFQRLMVAQDTGGAIKGLIRGDVFWGSGKNALKLAGPMKARGEFFIFLPKALDVTK